MTDPLRLLQAGDRLNGIPAAAWNAFVNAAKYVQQLQATGAAPALGNLIGPGQVFVLNNSGDDQDQYAVLQIDEALIAPADNQPGFASRVALSCVTPTANRKGSFVVLSRPIPAGEVGPAWIDGVCPARISGGGSWADTKNGETAYLEAGDYGNARIIADPTGGEDERWAYVRLNDPRVFILGKTVAGPGDTPYPTEGSNPKVYRVRILSNPSFPKEAGSVGVTATETDRYDFMCNLIGDEYIPEGSTCGMLELDGQLYTMDKVSGEGDCGCGGFPVFAMGGLGAGNDNDAYDPTADAWSSKTDLPSPSRSGHIALVEEGAGMIYCVGGNASQQDNDRYDAGADTWTAKTDMPEAPDAAQRIRGGVIGGDDGYLIYEKTVPAIPFDLHVGRNYRYRFATDAYTSRTEPTIRDHGTAGSWSLGGMIYLAATQLPGYSGLTPGTSQGTVSRYDPAANTWSDNSTLPHTHASPPDYDFQSGAAVYLPDASSSAYLISGADTFGGTTSTISKYTAGTSTWSTVGSIPSPGRGEAACANTGGIGYVSGGFDASVNALSQNQSYDGSTWTTKTPLPSPARGSHTAAAVS